MDILHLSSLASNETKLNIITFALSTIGCTLSIIALTMLIFTAILFSEWWRKYKNQVLIQFMIARFFYILSRYIFDASLIFGFYMKSTFMQNYDFIIHVFTELSLVAWMSVFAHTLHESLVIVIVMPSRYRLLRASLGAWLVPAASSFLLCLNSYVKQTITLSDFLIFFILVKWPLLLWNAVLLMKSLKSLSSKHRTLCHNRPDNNVKIVLTMVFLLFIFSLQQIIHDICKIVYLILYHKYDFVSYNIQNWVITVNILALYYCPISVSFWIIGNKHTRGLWKKYLKKKLNRIFVKNKKSGNKGDTSLSCNEVQETIKYIDIV